MLNAATAGNYRMLATNYRNAAAPALFPARPVTRPAPGAARDHTLPTDAQYRTLDARGLRQVDVASGPDCLYLALNEIAPGPVAAAMTARGVLPAGPRGTFTVPQLRNFVADWAAARYDAGDGIVTALVNGAGGRDAAVAAIREQRAEQTPIGGYLAQFAGQAFGLSINVVQDDANGPGGAATVALPVGAADGEPVWLIHRVEQGGQQRAHFLGAEPVVYGSDLVTAITVEATTRARQTGTVNPAGTLTEPFRWRYQPGESSGPAPALTADVVEGLPPIAGQVLAALPAQPGASPEEVVSSWLAGSTGPLLVNPVSERDVQSGQVVVWFPDGVARDGSGVDGGIGEQIAVVPAEGLAVELTVPDWPAPGSTLVVLAATQSPVPTAERPGPAEPPSGSDWRSRLRALVPDAAVGQRLIAAFRRMRSELFEHSWDGVHGLPTVDTATAQEPEPTEAPSTVYRGWMYAANGIPVATAARLVAGQSVALTEFAVASGDPGTVAGSQLVLASYGVALDLSASHGMPAGTVLLIPPGETYQVTAVDLSTASLTLTLVQ